MGKIQQLPESVYARIAAGEIIVNPAAAVKELIENAQDAGATGITVEISDGGKELIRVTDNGCGMSENDLLPAIQRHATSKIRAFDDLYALQSLGFRGEALSSMAEVSRLTLSSRERGSDVGARLTVAGGQDPEIEPVGVPEGTTVRIEDLFYNVPARRKFLKAGTREGALVSEVVRRALLSAPDIAFKYIRNGRVAYQSPGSGDLHAAVGCVYGAETMRELLDVHYCSGEYAIEGSVSRPSYIFKSTQRIDFFVNGRYIQSKMLRQALIRGYGESLLNGHYPLAVINIRMEPNLVDINSHPAKLNATFSDEDRVLSVVTEAVRAAVGVSTGAPYVAPSQPGARSTKAAPAQSKPDDFWVTVPRASRTSEVGNTAAPAQEMDRAEYSRSLAADLENARRFEAVPAQSEERDKRDAAGEGNQGDRQPQEMFDFAQMLQGVADEERRNEDGPAEPEADVRSLHEYRILGSAFATYIISESDGRLFFIDQHAARERLVYEQMVEWVQNGDRFGQMLLLPIVRRLPAPEFAVLQSNAQLLTELGLTFEEFGELTLRFFSIPVQMGAQDFDAFLTDVIEELRDHPDDPVIARNKLIASACRHSVKGGTELTEAEMDTLMQEITNMDAIPFCPHGRPIAVEMTREQLERGFRRRT